MSIAPAPRPLVLDAEQRRVLEHRGGPLLVLAGPGTGKTATLVECVADRVERDGDAPDQLLVLTYSRRAAAELRERVAARLGRVIREPLVRTFHSYAFGLLRRDAVMRGEPAPRLLSAAEQDVIVRELLAGEREEGRHGHWPAGLRAALPTRGFAHELRDLLLRAAERAIRPERLVELGRTHGRPDWESAGRFAGEYERVTALSRPAALDPAELVRAAVDLLAGDPAALEAERSARHAVFVDEYQDADPAQEDLLALLAGGGKDLVVVGDPDQSIYAFRGSDVELIRRFPERFRSSSGAPAPVVGLRTSRRFRPELLTASRRVASRLGGASAHRDLVAGGRGPEPLAAGTSPGRPAGVGQPVEVHVLASAGQEASFVAARLREAHLAGGVSWSRMAVIVRSAAPVPLLRRALQAAGVPVTVGREELALTEQAAVRPFLWLMEVAAGRRALDVPLVVELLGGPIGGADPLAQRRMRRELRRHELATGGDRSSDQLLVEAVLEPREVAVLDEQATAPARRVAAVLAAAREAATPGATAEDVLWAMWAASGLAGRWERRALAGGPGGVAADRDLDAVLSLFDAAERFADRLPMAGPEVFLDWLAGQEIPGDSLAARAPRPGEAVTLLTAHAAKGLEWDVVVAAAVQEGSWPDLRPRGSLLGTALLTHLADGGEVAPGVEAAARLAEERRLFYVAVTRARESLLVTAVAGTDDHPSRFLDELCPVEGERPVTTPARGLDLPSVVAELRSVVCAPADAVADEVRAGAAVELARLGAAGVRGADPREWYGLLPVSDERPVRLPGEGRRVSPSGVEAYTRCGLRWLAESVGGRAGSQVSQDVGVLVHSLAEEVGRGQIDAGDLVDRLVARWGEVDAGRGWSARRVRERATAMVDRLREWVLDEDRRELVDVEREFVVELPGSAATLSGRVDRIERDGDGRLVVVDFKTGRSAVRSADVPEHAQLAAYQVAVQAGGFAESRSAGGAELVQLGTPGVHLKVQRQAAPADRDDPGWAMRLVTAAAEGMAGSVFPATENSYCTICPARSSCPLQADGGQVVP